MIFPPPVTVPRLTGTLGESGQDPRCPVSFPSLMEQLPEANEEDDKKDLDKAMTGRIGRIGRIDGLMT